MPDQRQLAEQKLSSRQHRRQEALSLKLLMLPRLLSGTSRLVARTSPSASPLRSFLATRLRPRLLTRLLQLPALRAGPTTPPSRQQLLLLPTTASPRSSTTVAAVDAEDNTRVKDEVDTGVVAVAVLVVEASSVDVDAVVVTSGVAVVASAVLLAANRLRKKLTKNFSSLSLWVL